jgi:hypothetical protein
MRSNAIDARNRIRHEHCLSHATGNDRSPSNGTTIILSTVLVVMRMNFAGASGELAQIKA